MKRSAILRRTPFRSRAERSEVAARPAAKVCALVRAPAPAAPVFRPQPKHEYVRSDALMRAYRALPCQHCGADGADAGVCGAHANWEVFGKGKSIKADDNRAASLCATCHGLLDQGKSWSEEQRKRIWGHAHIKTVRKLVALSLWPAGVPVPDTSCVFESLGLSP